MKVTFPHMGNAHIAIKALFEGLRLEVIPPPPVTKRTMELGIKYSPEFACLPLKINVGNFLEGLEQGADTIVMAGGWGPCRFGFYAQVERDILRELGYDFKMVILEAPDSKLSQLFQQVKALGQNVTLKEAIRSIKFAWFKLNAVEEMEKSLEYYLPRVNDKNEAEKLYDKALIDIDAAGDRKDIKAVTEAAVKAFQVLPRHNRGVLKIGMVGEIYTILEPASNCDMVRCLGRLDAEVTRSIYLSEWINDNLLGGIIKKSNHAKIMKSSRPYLNYSVGGHGRETVGYAVEFARQKFDGIIQIGPLTCMPEIVAQTILPAVSEQEGIPCMTMYFDEHSGKAGIYTRLEAFNDMVRRRKQQDNDGMKGA